MTLARVLFPKQSLHKVLSGDDRQASFNRERDIPPIASALGYGLHQSRIPLLPGPLVASWAAGYRLAPDNYQKIILARLAALPTPDDARLSKCGGVDREHAPGLPRLKPKGPLS